jgi:hypothetical protein
VRVIGADDIGRLLTYPALIDALAQAFREDIVVPVRHHHTIPRPGSDATLLLMPAWTATGQNFIGCKLVTVFPNNAKAGRPSLYGTYLLASGETGEPLAVMDGRVLSASGQASRPHGCVSFGHDRGRRAGAASRACARLRATDRDRDAVEPNPCTGRAIGRGSTRPLCRRYRR